MVRLDRITMQGFKSFANRITIPFPSGFNVIAGPNGSGKSTRWDTEVILDTGEIRPIGEIVENALKKSYFHFQLDDGIYTIENPENIKTYGLDPEGMKVVKKDISAFIKREGEKYLYEFTTKTGKSAVTTGCHPVMVFRNGKIISEVVEKIKEGDLIATPRKLEFPETEIKLPVSDIGIVSNNKIVIKESRKNSEKIELPLYINENFSRFLGYLVGDGCIMPKANRCDLTNADEEIIEDFVNLSKEIGILPSLYERPKNKAKVVALHSSSLAEALNRIFRNNIKKESKHMPSIVLFSKKSILANFLAGLFDCDGTVRKNNPTFEYTTMSEKLANQVQLALLRFGIVTRKTKKMKHATNTKEKIKKPYFYITIEGKEKLKLLYENIPFRCIHKKERLKQIISREIILGSNIDVLPQEVNNLVRECTRLLGLKYKPLRRKYPWFASYNENRCCSTRSGIRKALDLFREKYAKIEDCNKNLCPEKHALIDSLNLLNIKRRHASKDIGLNRDSINNSWVFGKFGGKKNNLNNLYNYIKNIMEYRLKEAKKVIEVLENLSNSDIFWDRIEKIEKVPGEEWVYDLTIPNCHNFIGNGIFVHNSNVIDALTFVLGTTSARTIRAQKLQNLLFNGGRSRKPADFCEVSIYLDNNDGKMPGEKEVKITRRITRSGISIYKMNGKTVTRSKILDILSYTNLSPEGYNIIMQGDVTRIIEMSPLERKGFIDEISGITEFDEKKEKAVKELDHVDLRVRESMIIVAEKQRLVTRLKQEKETAEKYQRASSELRKSKASLIKKRLDASETKLKTFDKEIDEDTVKFGSLEKEFQKIESDLEKKEIKLKKINDEIISRSRNYEITRKIDSLETEILRKRDKIDLNERELARLKGMGSKDTVVQAVLDLDKPGIFGTVSSLVSVPKMYDIALTVAMGRHANDIVVEDDEIAAFCIKFLKGRKIGKARFIPLNKIKSKKRSEYRGKEKVIGYAIDLIKFNKKYEKAMEYVLGSTLVVDNIDIARKIDDFRVVTLDGDLVEISGAMIGGFHRKVQRVTYGNEIRKIENENEKFLSEIEKTEKELEKLRGQEKEETEDVVKLQSTKNEEDNLVTEMRKRRKEVYEERLILQNKLGKNKIEKARSEASLDNLRFESEDYKDVTEFYDISENELQERVRDALIEINRLGPVNLKAIEEFDVINIEFEELKKKLDKLLEEKESIMNVVKNIEQKRYSKFMDTFNAISSNFSKIYTDMTSGGLGRLRLEEENNIDSGLVIEASPVGKKVLNLDVMSGGEKTVTSLTFLFAIMQHSASPFYVLDEIDAALDKANTNKVANLIKNYSKNVQFIVITHNDITISMADKVFGVSMEDGASKVFGIRMPEG